MAKIDNGSGNPAMRGVGSSVILSIVVIMLASSVWFWTNQIQKTREGQGKFQFDEDLAFDITKKSDFLETWTGFKPNVLSVPGGTGGMVYNYASSTPPPPVNSIQSHSTVSILDVPLNGTLDGYGVSVAKVRTGDVVLTPQRIYFCMNFTKAKFIDLDITRMDIFLDIGGVSFTEVTVSIRGFDGVIDDIPINLENIATLKLNNLTKIKITVGDLLKINTLDSSDKILIFVTIPVGGVVPDNTFVIFDMQLYTIEEIKTISINQLAWVNIGIAFILNIISLLMFGSIRLRDAIDWLTTPSGGS